MYKLLLLSLLIATFALPAWAAGDANPRRGLKKAIVALAVFAIVWLLLIQYVYPKLWYPQL